MGKIHALAKPNQRPDGSPARGRIFKFALDGIPPVDEKMWAHMCNAARLPRKKRVYPEILEAEDAGAT